MTYIANVSITPVIIISAQQQNCSDFPNEDSLNRFFTNINSVHRNIVFTKELETNNCLHFLDILIEKTSTGFITSTYRKPTHAGLYLKWSSFVLLHRKRNLVNSLLRRTYDIASSYQLVHREFINIKRMLSRNGYPDKFLDRCIQQYLNRKYVVLQQRDAPAEHSPSPKYSIFHYNYCIWVLYLITYDRNSAAL